MSQASVTWHAPSLPYSPAPPTLTPRRSCKALALTHAPTRPGPFLPPVSFHCPMAEGQGKLSKPRQPSRVSALFPVPEPGPGGL